MKNLKKEKGITLIALILTIIVMLILVGVTINVAINGGLIEKAGIAKSAQEEALIKEQLQELVLGKMDTNLKIQTDLGEIKIGEDIYQVTAAEGTGENAGDIVLTLSGDKTLPTYTVAGDLKITGINIGATSESIAGTYFIGGSSTNGSLTFNSDGTIQQGEGISGFENVLWSYDVNSDKILLAIAEGHNDELLVNEAKFLTIKESGTVLNKIMIYNSENLGGREKAFLSTTQNGLCPFEGTYIAGDGSDRKFVFKKADCSCTSYFYQGDSSWVPDESSCGIYAVINGEFYLNGECFGPINQVDNYKEITILGDINCTLQQ